jgi:hypothetical protein
MESIRVEQLTYSSSSPSGIPPVTVQVGARQFEARIRTCSSSPSDVERLSILTSTLSGLPGTRDLAEGRHVSTRRRDKNHHTITVTLNREDDICTPYNRTEREVQRFWASIVEVLDQALPGYTFV